MSSDSKNPPILEVVKGAKKPPKKPDGTGGGIKIDKEQLFGGYAVLKSAFHQIKPKDDGSYDSWPLCDFTCKIIEEVTAEDGLNDASFLRIEGRRADGLPLPLVDVPAKAFFSTQGNWVNDHWGARPFMYPGAAKKDNLRACVQLYSKLAGDIPRRTIYRFTGWKKIDGSWHYLTGSGAITTNGLVDSVEVDLGLGNMNRYRLPAPLTGDQLKQAAADALQLLQVVPTRPQIGAALLAAVARAPLGECRHTNFIIWLHGQTGSRKSSLAAITQAFYGNFFDAESFPANWIDSAADAEVKAYQSKDSIFVIDDFKPSVSRSETDKLHALAERFIRGTGNGAGRGRRKPGMEAQNLYFNRSMTISTAEDLPRGQSLLGRMLVMELGAKDTDINVLSALQKAAIAGAFAGLMAAYLQWLAPRMDEYKRDFPKQVEQTRNSTIQSGFASSHSRAPEIYSNMVVASELFLDFLESAECISREQNTETLVKIETDLKAAFAEQSAYVQEQCEIERFFQLLRAAFSSHNAHIATVIKQGPPVSHSFAFGWVVAGRDLNGDEQYKAMGDCCGWYAEPNDGRPAEVWLEPNVSYKIVQEFARHQSDSFLMSAGSLWRRMVDKGILLRTEPVKGGKPNPTVKRVVAGVTKRVLVLAAELVESST